MVGLGGLALSYAAGALSTLSPCVLPLLPIILLGAVEEHRLGPLSLAAGLALSFTAMGVLIAAFGFSGGFDPALLRPGIAGLMVAIGVVLLAPSLQAKLAFSATPIASRGHMLLQGIRTGGIGGQFVLGTMLGLIWSPCAGPTLGAAIGLAAQSDTAPRATALMGMFSLGAVTPILLLAYGSRQAILARRDYLAHFAKIAKPITATVLILMGTVVLTGFDKSLEADLTRAMPDWLLTVTTGL